MEEVIIVVAPVMEAALATVAKDTGLAMDGQPTVRLVTPAMGADTTDLRIAMNRTTGTNLTATTIATRRRNLRAVAEARVRSGSASRMKESVRASARLSFRQALARKRFQRKRGKTASADRM